MMKEKACDLLCRMIAIPSLSRDEKAVADMIEEFLVSENAGTIRRFSNNIVVMPQSYNPSLPTLMLNSHIDTVKPAASYSFDPFLPKRENGKIYGLGSNDAGASVVSLTMAYLSLKERELPFNLLLAISAEEEVGGENGMRHLLPSLKNEGIEIGMAIVGEPTGMQPAVERKEKNRRGELLGAR